MGLDMYLSKRTYVGANYEHNNVEGEINLTKNNHPIDVNLKRVTYIEEELMYWRKVNWIHNWFVETLANGVDECQPIPVSKDDLVTLGKLCADVLNARDKADELLPATQGFFFGGTDYDEYYFDQTERTFNEIEKIIKEDNSHYHEYVYQASW